MEVTVAICTWNRAALLDQTLTRLRELDVPAGLAWELVVVDNNGTDTTPEVLDRHRDALPLRSFVERQQGHSHARNRAVAEARGGLILWTDDDVLVHPNWLREMAQVAAAHPDAQFFGGPIRPWFERPPPRWVADHLAELGVCWALLDHGPEVRKLGPAEYAYGANIGFRAEPLRRHPFDPKYGRVGKQLSSGDETRVIDAIRTQGGHGVWVGTAAVDHFLPAARMNPRYALEVLSWSGYYGHEAFLADRSPKFRGAPRWMWKRYLQGAVTRRLLGLYRGERWVRALLDEAKFRGLIRRLGEAAS